MTKFYVLFPSSVHERNEDGSLGVALCTCANVFTVEADTAAEAGTAMARALEAAVIDGARSALRETLAAVPPCGTGKDLS